MAVNSAAISSQINTAIVSMQNELSSVGNSLQDSSPVVLASVYQASQNALAPFITAINAYDSDIDTTSVGSVVVGLPATQLAAALVNQANDLTTQAVLVVTQAYVARIGVNLLNATG